MIVVWIAIDEDIKLCEKHSTLNCQIQVVGQTQV